MGCKFFRSSNLTHKSCRIFVASWRFAHCIGIRLVFHNLFYLNVRRANKAMQKKHKVLKMRLLIFTLAAFIRGSMGVGAYLFGEGYPSPMFQNGEGSFTNYFGQTEQKRSFTSVRWVSIESTNTHTHIMSKRVGDACR